jgi:hypothetical protein
LCSSFTTLAVSSGLGLFALLISQEMVAAASERQRHVEASPATATSFSVTDNPECTQGVVDDFHNVGR